MSLGIDTMPEPQVAKKKTIWNTVTTFVLSAMILVFFYIVFSNMYLLYMGKPLINMQH